MPLKVTARFTVAASAFPGLATLTQKTRVHVIGVITSSRWPLLLIAPGRLEFRVS
jgi:hypothetical protein